MPSILRHRSIVLTQILIICILLMQSCRQDSESADRSEGSGEATPVKVVTTTGMIADLVRSIGGDAVSVRSLMGVGVDPHLYKPTRDDITEILASQIVFFNGHHLEGRMGEILERAGEDRPTIAIAESVPTDDLLFPDGVDHHPDPHLWLSPRLWGMCSKSILDELIEIRPESAERFRTNHQKLLAECREMESYGREAIGTIPQESRLLITSHDAFSYFGRAFDIEVRAIQGISTESEAGLSDLEALVTLVVTRDVRAVFIESSVPRRSIEALIEGAAAKGHDVIIGGELYSDSMGPAGTPEGTWKGMVMHDIRTVTSGLGGSLPSGPDAGTDAAQ